MDTLQRFSNRVENYVRYRPNYPGDVIVFLQQQNILKQESVIADIGSGTGISTELFLKNGNTVYGVEPNKEMRETAEKLLIGYKKFKSIDATAENTTLQNESIDIIISGQAFHWFDKEKCKKEFKRILKKNGSVVLMWNDRRMDSSEFLIAYESLLKKFGTDYLKVNHKNIDDEQFDDFFGNKASLKSFENYQYFDFVGLKGRLLSSSYVPAEVEANFEPMINALEDVFEKYNSNGKVTFEYDTKIYYGQLK